MTAGVSLERSVAALDRERVRRGGFKEFVRRAWPHVESSPLRWSWHLDAVAEHLEAVQRREIQELVINVPPGSSKTLLASVLWPAFVWTLDPEHRFICASFNDDVILHNARRARSLVASPWWAARWPGVALPTGSTASKAVNFYANTRGGWRYSVTVKGAVLGMHADTHVTDDPMDPQGAAMPSGVELDGVLRWHGETMSTRFRDHQRKARVLVMQRLHVRDLSAEMRRNGATVLCLPMRYEPAHPDRYPKDPRADGELLTPERYPEPVVKALEKDLGPYGAAAQLQQRPAPKGGGIIRAEWMRNYWVDLPKTGTWALTIDCAFKDTKDASLVAFQAWCHAGASFYLIDRWTERRDFQKTCDDLVIFSERWPKAFRRLIENKANGPAVISALRRVLPGLEEVEPDGGKESRAHAIVPFFSSGNVILPHPERAIYPDGRRGAAWLRGGVTDLSMDAAEGSYENVITMFPKGVQSDDMDATSQYLNATGGSYLSRLRAAMDALKKGQTS